jgi:hypothetical protein
MPSEQITSDNNREDTSRSAFDVTIKKEDEKKHSNTIGIDNMLKIVTALITAGGFIFGIITFQAQQKNIQTENFKMKLWEKKLDIYTSLSDIAGNIIIFRNDSLALDSLIEKFDKIYYSSIILVQDDSVEANIRTYKDALSDYRQGFKSILYLKEHQVCLMRAIGQSLKQTQDFGNEK